jgi:hypothetical protein
LERDLERVLEDLAHEFPLLRSLVDRRAGGQKRLPLPGRGTDAVPGSLFANVDGARGEAGATPAPPSERLGLPPGGGPSGKRDPSEPAVPEGEPDPAKPVPPPDVGRADSSRSPAVVGTLDTVPGRRRPARYALTVQFESRPDDTELGRLVDSTIWINEAHPAYLRAAASRSTGYHTALTVALALAPLAVGASDEHAFLTQFLTHWGDASGTRQGRSRPAGRKHR